MIGAIEAMDPLATLTTIDTNEGNHSIVLILYQKINLLEGIHKLVI